jgi:probable HAF family extracellular repeat protein
MFHRLRKIAYLPVTGMILGLALRMMAGGTAIAATTSSAGSLFHAAGSSSSVAADYQFRTLNDQADPTFNQLLGINNSGTIAGYFGSGAVVNGKLHPNKGYTVMSAYTQGNYTNENFPGSVQTQVTAIDNAGDTAGFWVDGAGNNFDFVEWAGGFTSYKDPHTGTFNGVKVNQLLGLNDQGIAVGFYTDSYGNNHGYTLNQDTGKFSEIRTASIPGAVSVMATGINKHGDVVGSYTDGSGTTHGFLRKGSRMSVFDYPGIANLTGTTFLGVNTADQIVGSYTMGTGNAAQMHGFLLSSPLHHAQWQTIDDPHGVGTTTINGLNDLADIVGFYVDGQGNTDGFLARQ